MIQIMSGMYFIPDVQFCKEMVTFSNRLYTVYAVY